MSKMKQPFSYGVPSGPMIRALRQSTRFSSTLSSASTSKRTYLRKIVECHATGKFRVRIASSFAMARDRFGASCYQLDTSNGRGITHDVLDIRDFSIISVLVRWQRFVIIVRERHVAILESGSHRPFLICSSAFPGSRVTDIY